MSDPKFKFRALHDIVTQGLSGEADELCRSDVFSFLEELRTKAIRTDALEAENAALKCARDGLVSDVAALVKERDEAHAQIERLRAHIKTCEGTITQLGYDVRNLRELAQAHDKAAQEPVAVSDLPMFPTMLRKMWSGTEVQQWIDDCLKPLFQERHFHFHCDERVAEAAHVAAQEPKSITTFGTGNVVVIEGTFDGLPAVVLREATQPGIVGSSARREPELSDENLHECMVFTFPTEEQVGRVADALVNAAPQQASEQSAEKNHGN